MTRVDSHLCAVYDLAISPASFDILCYLVEAERHRRERLLSGIKILVVPIAENGIRLFDLHTEIQDKWRVSNIVLASCELLPTVRGFTLATSRAEARALLEKTTGEIFPTGYTVEQPKAHHHTAWPVIAAHMGANLQCLRASEQAKRYARQWLEARAGGRKAIVLTLREATFTPKRNSDVGEWLRFARLLEQAGYFPVVIRDTDCALDAADSAFSGVTLFAEAAFNLDLRMGLYEECHIATFVSNGPSTPCYFDRNVRYLYFVTGEWRDEMPPTFNRVGIGGGTTPPFANAYQRWIWCDQNADRFMNELIALDALIDRRNSEGTFEAGLDPVPERRDPLLEVARRIELWSNLHGSPAEWEIHAHCLEHSPERAAGNPDVITKLAHSYLRLGEHDRALACCRENIDRCPSEANYRTLGLLYETMGRIDDACSFYHEALQEISSSELLRFRYHVCLGACGNAGPAISYFQTLIDRGAMEKRVFLELGKLYERMGQMEKALGVYKDAIARGVVVQEIFDRKIVLSTSLPRPLQT